MKIEYKLLLLMILLQCPLIKSQNVIEVDFASPTKEEKQLIIANLAISSEAGSAALKITNYSIKEAIPDLLKHYRNQEPVVKYYFLGALAACEYKGALQLFHNFIDSTNVYNLNQRKNYKANVAALLIELGDYSRRDLIYDDLEKNFDGLAVAIQAANVLDDLIINVPAEEAKAKEQLLNIARNAKYDFARSMALRNLFEIYKESMLPVLKERFVTDTTYSTRISILKYMLAKVKTSETISFLQECAANEPDLSIRHTILGILLEAFGSPIIFSYVKNNKSLLAEWQYKNVLNLDLHFFQARIDSNTTLITNLDSLISFHTQCSSFNWLGNTSFSEQLKPFLSDAKTKLNSSDSLGAALNIKQYQSAIVQARKDSTADRFVTEDGYKFLYYYPKYILERLPKLAE